MSRTDPFAGLEQVGEVPEKATHVLTVWNTANHPSRPNAIAYQAWAQGQGAVETEIFCLRANSLLHHYDHVDVVDRETNLVTRIRL
ncbi:MAG TPA: hypothetical protein VIJ94_09290 [Caulobacteraceae bacterium]